jgi:hypothetical protein
MGTFIAAGRMEEQCAGSLSLDVISNRTLCVRTSDGSELARVEGEQIGKKHFVSFKRPVGKCARIEFLLFQELGGTRVSGEYNGTPFVIRISHDGALHGNNELGNLDADDRQFFRFLLGILGNRLKKRTSVRVNRYGVAAINALNDLAKSVGCPEFLHCALSYVALVAAQPPIPASNGNWWSSGAH